ncbi:MAG: hypothetical protein LQ343_000824 [Gyalolechia ehrenbergii]|nr:MAG: hypothetical protein LQ343_000824 [Gyalolechia ehrenbergii]
MAPQLAWIGLGNMGRVRHYLLPHLFYPVADNDSQGMCKNLVEKGNLSRPLIISNRTLQRAKDFQSTLPFNKSTIAKTITDAVSDSDIIFTCLGDDAAIKETVSTISEIPNIKGKLFVDCSTVHPDTTNEIAESFAAHAAEFVACPVFGAPAIADAGQLVCVLAGPKESVEKVLPYCKGVMGRANIDFSDQPHAKATLLKINGNTFILNLVETLSEGHVLAEKSGLGSDNLHKFIETMFPGPYTAYSGRMMSGDYHKREQPLFGVDLARKDAKHALDLAEASGARMRDVEVADGHLADVQKHMGSKGDIAGIYGAVRKESGLNFEN